MATYDLAFNIAKGAIAYYWRLPAANDAIIAIPLRSTGIVAASTMRDYDTVADVLAGATDEQTEMGRKTCSGVTATVDDSGDFVLCDFNDITWTAATGPNTAALLLAYDPDTTGGSDSDLVPLLCLDMPATPGGGDLSYLVATGGVYKAV